MKSSQQFCKQRPWKRKPSSEQVNYTIHVIWWWWSPCKDYIMIWSFLGTQLRWWYSEYTRVGNRRLVNVHLPVSKMEDSSSGKYFFPLFRTTKNHHDAISRHLKPKTHCKDKWQTNIVRGKKMLWRSWFGRYSLALPGLQEGRWYSKPAGGTSGRWRKQQGQSFGNRENYRKGVAYM